MGGPPFGKGRMANWRPRRPAVFAGSSACCDAGEGSTGVFKGRCGLW